MAAQISIFNGPDTEHPESQPIETRYSTPVSDLDDHRQHTSTRPRGDTLLTLPHAHRRQSITESPLQREKTLPSDDDSDGRYRHGLYEALAQRHSPEHVILEDDASAAGDDIIERQLSNVLPLPSRGIHRASRNLNRSRESSSSRSSSQANSVDAFAQPRRRDRANTAESRVPSEFHMRQPRTNSGCTQTRRPTVTSVSVCDFKVQDDRASIRSAEEDVCFPVIKEPTKTSKIDFEELDEFVSNKGLAKGVQDCRGRQKLSFSSHGNLPLVSAALRAEHTPKIITTDAPKVKVRSESDGTASHDTVLDEKLEAKTDAILGLDEHGIPLQKEEPARYSFFSTELEKTIHAPNFGELLTPGETFRDLFDLPEEGGLWWLDMQNPTEDEMEAFQKAFGIHRLTTEDIMTQEAREKVELFNQYYFVCFRSFWQVDKEHEDYMEPVNVYMVVFREGILTITYDQSPHAANVRKRIGKLRDYVSLTVDWICYAMIDDIVDSFGPPIQKIETEADTIEDQVFIARTGDFTHLLRQIGDCRKNVTSLMRLLGGKADVIKGFSKRCNEDYKVAPRGDIGMYLGDIQDHVVTMMSNLGHFEKILSRSHSNYLAQLSIDQIAQGNRANEVLSKITLLASILVPLNLVCGLFGMNVNVPGKTADGLGWFFGILGGIVLFSCVCLLTAKRLRYF